MYKKCYICIAFNQIYFFRLPRYRYSVALLIPVVVKISLTGMFPASYIAIACWIFFESVFGLPPSLPLALAAASPSMAQR